MPVGVGLGDARSPRAEAAQADRFTGPRGFHPGALGLAALAPLLATLLLLARMAA